MREGRRTILLVALADAQKVERSLRELGHRTLAARDGAEGLASVVSLLPDLILLDEGCQVLGADAFIRIVKSNPKTAKIPILRSSQGFSPQAVELALAKAAPRRSEREVTAGSLGPLSVLDLLQALRADRRSGRLALHGDGGQGEIWIEGGELCDARFGKVKGKKALFRLISLAEGRFELFQGSSGRGRRLEGGFDGLLLEAAYQQDELARTLADLPAPQQRLVALLDPHTLPSERPLFSAILGLLWGSPHTLGELLDRCEALDLEIARAVKELLRIGWVGAAPAAPGEVAPLLPEAARILLGKRLPQPSHRGQVAAKVLLLGDDPVDVEQLMGVLATRGEVRAHATGVPWGTVGTLDLGDGLLIDLVALPQEEELAPLAISLSRGALGGLAAGRADGWGWLGSGGAWPLVDALPGDPLPALRELLVHLAR